MAPHPLKGAITEGQCPLAHHKSNYIASAQKGTGDSGITFKRGPVGPALPSLGETQRPCPGLTSPSHSPPTTRAGTRYSPEYRHGPGILRGQWPAPP